MYTKGTCHKGTCHKGTCQQAHAIKAHAIKAHAAHNTQTMAHAIKAHAKLQLTSCDRESPNSRSRANSPLFSCCDSEARALAIVACVTGIRSGCTCGCCLMKAAKALDTRVCLLLSFSVRNAINAEEDS